VSYELPLDQAPEAYKRFDASETGWTKVVLKPGVAEAKKGQAAPGRLVDIGGHRLQSAKNHTLCLRQQLLLGL